MIHRITSVLTGPEGEFDHGGVVLGAYLYEDYGIKSPRILKKRNGKYYNFYNAANGNIEQMGLATSNDLHKWERYEHNPVIPVGSEGSFNERFSSDSKIFWEKEHWVSFFFGVGQDGAHIMAAFSRDLYHWSVDPEPLYKAGGNPSGLDGQYAHKISLVWNPSNLTYYIFYCAVLMDLIIHRLYNQMGHQNCIPRP